MNDELTLRPVLPADLLEISALVAGLTPRHVGTTAGAEGLRHLRDYMEPGAIGRRLTDLVYPARNPAIVACLGSVVIGYGAVRNDTHISQIYVAEAWHRRGIGSALLRDLIVAIQVCHPAANAVTLNATPRAVEFYLRFGFTPLGPWQAWSTGLSLPMTYAAAERFGART